MFDPRLMAAVPLLEISPSNLFVPVIEDPTTLKFCVANAAYLNTGRAGLLLVFVRKLELGVLEVDAGTVRLRTLRTNTCGGWF
jgi:hypothetical protein